MKVQKYSQANDLSVDEITQILIASGSLWREGNYELSDGEVIVLDTHKAVQDDATEESEAELSDATEVSDEDEVEETDDVENSAAADADEEAPKVTSDATKTVQPRSRITSKKTKSGRSSKAPLTPTELADLDVARRIRDLQKTVRRIDGQDYELKVVIPGEPPVKFYRPTYHPEKIDGEWYQVYDSLVPGEAKFKLTEEDIESYDKGKKKFMHMDFVQHESMQLLYRLFQSYSFFNNECSRPECKEIRLKPFNPGLKKKAELIIRKYYLPPEYPVSPGSKTQVMKLKGQCYVHWLLEESRDIIIPKWFEVTAATQKSPADQRSAARVGMFVDLIDEIMTAVSEKAKRGGERAATEDEIGDMLIAFAEER